VASTSKGGKARVLFTIEVDAITVSLLALLILALSATK
jgi:hypothetical protein